MSIPNFQAGFIGALAPEVIKLYKLRNRKKKFTWYYFLISALYGGVGGYLGYIQPTLEQLWAFAQGAALPVVVALLAKTVVDRMKQPEGSSKSPNAAYDVGVESENGNGDTIGILEYIAGLF
jgi:hypothetical protein